MPVPGLGGLRWIFRLGLPLLMIATTGCDQVFGLEGQDAGAPDAVAPDAVVLANHDEDADGVDDAIDLCPGTPDDQADQDLDGVGDACDPHPTLAIDQLAYFSSLREFDDWSVRAGTWTQDGDEVRITTETSSQLAVLLGPGAFLEPTVLATIDELSSSNTFYGFGVYLVTDISGASALPPGLACYEIQRLGTEELEVFDARTSMAVKVPFGAYALPVQVTLQASSGATTPAGPPLCKAKPTTGTANVVSPMDGSVIQSAHVGLYSYFAKARFRSVTVIARRP